MWRDMTGMCGGEARLAGRCVLVTGGTRGIGLATGLAFGRLGASAVLTHRWGSADEDAIRVAFAEAGAPEPDIVEADAGHGPDLDALLARGRIVDRGTRQARAGPRRRSDCNRRGGAVAR